MIHSFSSIGSGENSITTKSLGGLSMAKIIPFPSKNNFLDQFKGNIPDDILSYMAAAYDRVDQLRANYPSAEFRVAPGFEETATALKQDFETYTLGLLKRILELESELCLATRKT
jgi:hypothetical protein